MNKTWKPLVALLALMSAGSLDAQSPEPKGTEPSFELAVAKYRLEGDPTGLQAIVDAGGAQAATAKQLLGQDESEDAAKQGRGSRKMSSKDRNAVEAVVYGWIREPNAARSGELDWLGERAVPTLVDVFDDQGIDLVKRGMVAEKIVRIGGKDAERWLRRQFSQAKGLTRDVVVRSIVAARRYVAGRGTRTEVTPVVAKFFEPFDGASSDENASIQARMLEAYWDYVPVEDFGKWMQHPNESVRVAAIEHLWRYYDPTRTTTTNRQVPDEERRRARAYVHELESILTAPMSETIRDAIRSWTQGSIGYVQQALPPSEYAPLVEALLPQFSVGLTVRSSAARIRRTFDACVERGADRADAIAGWLSISAHEFDAEDVEPYLAIAARWHELENKEGKDRSGVGTVVWGRIKSFLKPEHAPALVEAFGSPLFRRVRMSPDIPESVQRDVGRGLRSELLAGRIPMGDKWRDAMAMATIEQDLEAAKWLQAYYERAGDAELRGWASWVVPDERDAVPVLVFFFRKGLEEKDVGPAQGAIFGKLLLLAASEVESDLVAGIRAGLREVTVRQQKQTTSGRFSRQNVSLVTALTAFRAGRFEYHDGADDFVERLLEAHLAVATPEDFASIQGAVQAAFQPNPGRTQQQMGEHHVPVAFLDALWKKLESLDVPNDIHAQSFVNLERIIAREYDRLQDPDAFVRSILRDPANVAPSKRNLVSSLLYAMRGRDSVAPEHLLLAVPFLGTESAAISALADVDDQKVVQAIEARVRELLASENSNERRTALAVIKERGGDTLLEVGLPMLSDSNAMVRGAAIGVYGKHYYEPAADGLLAALRDDLESNRKIAKEALDRMRDIQQQENHWKQWRLARGQPSVSAALLAQAADTEPLDVRLAALRSLALLGDVEALPFLIEQMKSDDESIRKAAKDAVDTLQAIASKRAK
ncbi:MAG: HEAT repeat domain-containing protein [Planctomycetes bacterium]|nr:HEAT repeat domain-containing protein [Planctomycetota bacterium]MCB9916918.1 HEAT repeat domain-containing protein [Planctomycetota bacterium]